MLAMSKAATDLALPGNHRSKHWNSDFFEKASFDFTVQPYIPKRPCRATNLYTWSRFYRGSATHDRQEHIPLASIGTTPVVQVDSDGSLCGSEDTDPWCKSCIAKPARSGPEPLVFNIHLEGQTYVKLLDYTTFARWENVEVLLEGFEGEDGVIQQLWDVREDMPIWSGDWDARVYPGQEIDVICSRSIFEENEVDSSSDSEDDDDEEEEIEAQARNDVHPGGHRWWFRRWRMKVEQESMGTGGAVRQPSRRMLLLGTLAMATFLGIVFVFCTL
jgi:hypothetical protein